jgi:hypothetical protein
MHVEEEMMARLAREFVLKATDERRGEEVGGCNKIIDSP